EGPIAIVESISPERSMWSKHVVHIVFAGELDGSLEGVMSSDEAGRGHRLFTPDELDGIALHPPIARFLARWQPGDPCVYLGARWAAEESGRTCAAASRSPGGDGVSRGLELVVGRGERLRLAPARVRDGPGAQQVGERGGGGQHVTA